MMIFANIRQRFPAAGQRRAARQVRSTGTCGAWGRVDKAGLRQAGEGAWIADRTAVSWLRLTLILIQP